MNRSFTGSLVHKFLWMAAFFAFLSAFLPSASVQAEETTGSDLTILFTTDIHSALIPKSAYVEGRGQKVGGFARLKSAIDENSVPDATILLDSGDFSMGSIFQSFCISLLFFFFFF